MTYKIKDMDTKLTLSFDKDVIEEAKEFAGRNGMSLSRFIEHLLRRATSEKQKAIEQYPISEWVMELMEGPVEYGTISTKKEIRAERYEGRTQKKKTK